MIPQETIQEIVSRIDIIEIVGEFVRLKRRGANYLGLCPFHDERTPSFTVSPTKEIFKCFGCGKSGNAITFLMEHEKYNYVEAIRWLADKYQVVIEETHADPEYKKHQHIADSLYAINNFAQKHFRDNLMETEDGRAIGLSYLKERGYRQKTIDSFGLGYCLSDDSFARAAIENQFNKDLLLKSGLVVLRDGSYRDNYRGRIIFPIHNQTGKVVGFGARLLQKNDRAPKYINTPENEIYNKSKLLYGLWQARQSIGKTDECILVEGYTDVVSLHQAGIENAVASGGTSLTSDQLRLIRKITPNLTIFYDGDTAGISATLRGLDLALEEGLNVKVVSLPGGHDPDSYINEMGAAALENFIKENKKDFILFQLDWALQAGEDRVKKTAAIKKIADSISRLNRPEDFVMRQEYVKKVAAVLEIDEEGLISLINSILREQASKRQNKFLSGDPTSREPQPTGSAAEPGVQESEEAAIFSTSETLHENALVRCLLEYGDKMWDEEQSVAEYLLNEWVIDDIITDDTLKKIIARYRSQFDNGELPNLKTFLYSDDPELNKAAINLIYFPYEVSRNWEEKYRQEVPDKEDQYIADITSTLRYIDLKNIKKLLEENQREIQKEQPFDKLTILLKTQQHLLNMEQDLARQVGMVILK